MIKIYEYRAVHDGPTVTIFGALHGNEPCGPQAIQKITEKFENKKLTLLRGRIILVPISNPLAYQKNKRYIDEDLNRIFRKTTRPKTYEQELANILCGLIDATDVFVDVHSTGAKGPPTVFLDFPTHSNTALAKSTGIHLAIVGWPKLYENDKRLISYDTTVYAHDKKKDGILVECGQHADPNAPNVAEQVIIHVLKQYQMIPHGKNYHAAQPQKLKKIKMTELFIKEHKNDSFSRRWKHLEAVKKGQVIAKRNSGELIRAPNDRVMMLPKYSPPIGKEWFYLGLYTK